MYINDLYDYEDCIGGETIMALTREEQIERINRSYFKARKKVLLEEQSNRLSDKEKRHREQIKASKRDGKMVTQYQKDKIHKSLYGRWK